MHSDVLFFATTSALSLVILLLAVLFEADLIVADHSDVFQICSYGIRTWLLKLHNTAPLLSAMSSLPILKTFRFQADFDVRFHDDDLGGVQIVRPMGAHLVNPVRPGRLEPLHPGAIVKVVSTSGMEQELFVLKVFINDQNGSDPMIATGTIRDASVFNGLFILGRDILGRGIDLHLAWMGITTTYYQHWDRVLGCAHHQLCSLKAEVVSVAAATADESSEIDWDHVMRFQ